MILARVGEDGVDEVGEVNRIADGFFSETQKVWKVVFEGNAAKYKTNQTYRSVSIMFLLVIFLLISIKSIVSIFMRIFH